MATLTSRIEALIAYANETTGMGDKTLGEAVKTLAYGYGTGGYVLIGDIKLRETSNVFTIVTNKNALPKSIMVQITDRTQQATTDFMMLTSTFGGTFFTGMGMAFNRDMTELVYNTSYNTRKDIGEVSGTGQFAVSENAIQFYSITNARTFAADSTYHYEIHY